MTDHERKSWIRRAMIRLGHLGDVPVETLRALDAESLARAFERPMEAP